MKENIESINILLDPEISNEEINKIFFEGDLQKLYKLSKNVRFQEYDPEVFISMSKIKIPFYQNNDYQTIFIMGLLIINIFISGVKDISNISLLCVLGYLFYKSKDYKKKLKILEQERIIYIQKILKGSEFSIDHLIDENIWNND